MPPAKKMAGAYDVICREQEERGGWGAYVSYCRVGNMPVHAALSPPLGVHPSSPSPFPAEQAPRRTKSIMLSGEKR